MAEPGLEQEVCGILTCPIPIFFSQLGSGLEANGLTSMVGMKIGSLAAPGKGEDRLGPLKSSQDICLSR